MADSLLTLDVRPILRAGGEPFAEIMKAVSSLEPGQGLKLFATFRPVPLFSVMAKNGFDHREQELSGGDWEVVFTPSSEKGSKGDLPTSAPATPPRRAREAEREIDAGEGGPDDWPAASLVLDNRGLQPPEPMVRTLEAITGLSTGDVLEIWNDRDPQFLYPELEARGHQSHREVRGAEGYRILIRKGDVRQGKL
ncbi:MAG: DUF2249 domain-containing protein [Parvibaculum sp.]